MAKKKKYVAKKDDDWNPEEARKHRRAIRENEKRINDKYKKWWDINGKGWKEGFEGHGDS